MQRINTFIKVLTVGLLCVAFILTGCVRATPTAQETTSSPHEQMKPLKNRTAAPEMDAVNRKQAKKQSKEVALNTKRQTEKKSATRVATPSIVKIEISPRAHSLNPCEQKKFSAAVKDNSGRQIKDANVTWESTDPKIATVNKNGVVTGVSPGFTFIRAINGKIKSNSSSLFVRDKQADRGC